MVSSGTLEVTGGVLKLISCSCKSGCGKRCGCVKVGLSCSAMCTICSGQACLNSISVMHAADELTSDDEDTTLL